MPTTLTALVALTIQATYQNTLDFGSAEYKPGYNFRIDFADGLGLNQAQKVFTDQRTLTASATEDLDLAGVLTDAFGAALTFTEIKAMAIKASASNTNNVIVGNATTNGFITWVGGAAHTVTVRPGGILLLVAPDATGYAVTAGTGDILKIANSAGGTSVVYDIVLIGN